MCGQGVNKCILLLGQKDLGWNAGLPPSSCATLGKELNLSEPQVSALVKE